VLSSFLEGVRLAPAGSPIGPWNSATEVGVGTPNIGVAGGYTIYLPPVPSYQPFDPRFPLVPIGDGLFYAPDPADPFYNH